MPMIPTRPLGRLGFLSAISGTIRVGADVTRFRPARGAAGGLHYSGIEGCDHPHVTVPNCRG